MITTEALQIEKGLIRRIDSLLSGHVEGENTLLITGKSFSKSIADTYIKTSFLYRYAVRENSLAELNDFTDSVLSMNIKYIVAVGGGSVIDFAKRLALFRNVKLYVIPTIVSNDGLFSPIAVLKDLEGRSVSLKGQHPDGVFVDLDLLYEAPNEFIYSAVADLFSNISATNDWLYSEQITGKRTNSVALTLSRQSANLVIDTLQDLDSVEMLERIVFAQLMSGSAMYIAGSSRPCSGAEHLLSHAIDFHGFSNGKTLHGTQVGSLSIFTLYLHNQLNYKIFKVAEALNLCLDWTDILFERDESVLKQIFQTALTIRPGRVTILNSFQTSEDFLDSIRTFRNIIFDRNK